MVYYHVSPKSIGGLRNTSDPDRVAVKIGKPSGFWYAKEKSWLPILNREEGHGILNAMRMTIRNEEVVGVNPKKPHTIIKTANKEYLLYQVNIPEAEKTTNPSETHKNKICVLTSDNLEQFYSDLFEPTLTDDAIAEHLGTYVYKDLMEDLSFIIKYLDDIDAPEDDDEEGQAWMAEVDAGDISDPGLVLEWFEKSIKEMIHEEGVKDEILGWPGIKKFVVQKHWTNFWFTSGFTGVEFDASVLNIVDERFPFLPFVEIESGCIWKPSVLHVTLEEVGRISFNTGSNESFNVYVKQNGRVKQKRKGVRGGSRGRSNRLVYRNTRRKKKTN